MKLLTYNLGLATNYTKAACDQTKFAAIKACQVERCTPGKTCTTTDQDGNTLEGVPSLMDSMGFTLGKCVLAQYPHLANLGESYL